MRSLNILKHNFIQRWLIINGDKFPKLVACEFYNICKDTLTTSGLVLVYLLSFIGICSATARTNLMVTRVGPCYDEPPTIVSVSEFNLSTKSIDTWLIGTMNISEDIEDGWSIKATMKKCLDMRNIDTCDHFKSFPYIKDGCVNFEEDDETMYALLFHYTEPGLSCPIKAGNYTITNFPLYTEDNYLTVHESKISTSVFGYTFRLDGFDKFERKILCVEAYLLLLYMREHRWTKSKTSQDVQTTTEKASDENDKKK